jgi:hypothetical protein
VAKVSTALVATEAPLGTSFVFALSEAADVQIAIRQSVPGRRRGHRCVVPTAKLRRARAKQCTRTLTRGVMTRSNEHQGANSVPFSGRMGRRPLHPGAYTAVLTASNANGRSRAVTLSFIVVR